MGQGKCCIIDKRSLKGRNTREYLGLLRKSDLEVIRKYHAMELASALKKDMLADGIYDYLTRELEEILTYIPTMEYSALMEMLGGRQAVTDAFEEIPEDLDDLRSMGLIFPVDAGKGNMEWHMPDDARIAIKRISSNGEFKRKRDFTAKIEHIMISIFFYWGVVRRDELFNETARLMGTSQEDGLFPQIGKVFQYLSNSYIDRDQVENVSYYSMFSSDPVAQVISNSWQKAAYPEIISDGMALAEEGYVGCVLLNPYFRMMYEWLIEMSEMGQDEELDGDAILETVSLVADYIVNARPGTTVEQIAENLRIVEDLKSSPDVRELLNNMLLYSPNYWIKGNAVSGKVHLIPVKSKLAGAGRNSGPKGGKAAGKAAEKAAQKWKVGGNDPCPCGSGKKFKQCCM